MNDESAPALSLQGDEDVWLVLFLVQLLLVMQPEEHPFGHLKSDT